MSYHGVIIGESLEDTSVLQDCTILKTEIENVTAKHKTPWIQKWTLHNVEISEENAKKFAERLSHSLDQKHSWYADFKNETHHFIIFRDKVFLIDRTSKKQYNEAKNYGTSLGIPEYQVDFHPEVKQWQRPDEK